MCVCSHLFDLKVKNKNALKTHILSMSISEVSLLITLQIQFLVSWSQALC